MEKTSQISIYLGKNLLDLRRKKNWSQNQLAKAASIPRTTLTNIESGMGNPSLRNLIKLAGALGVGVEELLSRPRSSCQVVPAAEIPIKKRSGGRVLVHQLLPDKIKGLGIEKIDFEPEAIMGGNPHLSGTKEYFYVLKGEITISLAGEKYDLKKGDVFAFPGNQPHSYQNKKRYSAVGLSVIIPIPASV